MIPAKAEHARKHLVGLSVALSALSCADGSSKSAPLSPLTESATSTSAVARTNTDRATLVEFYRATGGDDWTQRDGWLSEAPISSWYGVTVDGDRVVGLELSRNNLKGRLPAALGQLAGLRRLDLPYNKLWGRIPPGFGQLAELEYLDLRVNELTGPLPPELAKLSRLRVLGLISSGNSGPIPAWLGDLAELRWLELGENPMGGRIPPELGKLRNLEILYLENAGLSGPIPPELGNLTNLRFLYLGRNYFGSPIPPEFGKLTQLRALHSWGSHLTGEIPPELGNLTNLTRITLELNSLSGPIPPTLGNLDQLTELLLWSNALTGPVPAELGRLRRLEELSLHDNRLEGELPASLGELPWLRILTLGSNPRLTGGVPREWLRLKLNHLGLGKTDVCASDDPEFRAWLGVIPIYELLPCDAEAVDAYLVQATQSLTSPIPLVAGREALLRVFVTASRADGVTFPAVRANFYRHGGLTHVVEIPGSDGPIPPEVDEWDLGNSANAAIPARVVQPGLELVIEVDPLGVVDASVDMPRRMPPEGRLAVRVEEMPAFRLTAIPWISRIDRDESIVELTRNLSAESPVFAATKTLLPIGDFDLTVHEPVHTTSGTGFGVLADTKALRVLEGGEGYYLGLSAKAAPDVLGVALLDGWSAYSVFDSGVVSHELGHNLSLGHAPCGVQGDPNFPYADGSVGSVGYDFARKRTILPTTTKDLMSYCGPAWVADWSFRKMLLRRLTKEGMAAQRLAASSPPMPALLLWGGADAQGTPFLNPAFAVEAPVALPTATGPYEIVGTASDGTVLFELHFAMQASSEEGRSGFAFAVPAAPEWVATLTEITLRGPGGDATLTGETDRPSVILRDPATGRVRAMFIDMPPSALAASTAELRSSLGSLQTLRSRGLPESDDRR